MSLINAGLAQSKGRSGLLWWLVSLLIGPIATPLIVILPAALSRYGTQPCQSTNSASAAIVA
ncbi:MAG: hypothetical protein EA424_01735, partial [Planctomycetaceae bacterium]